VKSPPPAPQPPAASGEGKPIVVQIENILLTHGAHTEELTSDLMKFFLSRPAERMTAEERAAQIIHEVRKRLTFWETRVIQAADAWDVVAGQQGDAASP
jgi:hypothetical protein